VRTFCGQGEGVLQMQTSVLFGAKKFGFFEIYGMSTWTKGEGGLGQCGHASEKDGVNFSQFCAGVLYGRPHKNCAEKLTTNYVELQMESCTEKLETNTAFP